ncbi:MAG: hypothetical protein JXA25_20475 [Anaerolineales bacterium]|nr:hypothetical protein [Anaerolineales bacterium]
MFTKKNTLIIVLALVFLLSGCGPSDEEIRATEEADATRVYSTAAAIMTEAAEAFTDTPTVTSTVTATITPTVTFTSGAGVTITSQPLTTPCNLIGFVSDVTIPDGTEFSAGESFTKTWRLRNDGTCTWDSTYTIIFTSGDQLSGVASKKLTTGTVAPGATIDVSVDLKAPGTAGTYTGYWLLKAGDGSNFGVDRAGSAFYVQIVVPGDGPTATAGPTATRTATGSSPSSTPTATATTEVEPTEETSEGG